MTRDARQRVTSTSTTNATASAPIATDHWNVEPNVWAEPEPRRVRVGLPFGGVTACLGCACLLLLIEHEE